MKYVLPLSLLVTLLLSSCNSGKEVATTETAPETAERKLAKFEPADVNAFAFQPFTILS